MNRTCNKSSIMLRRQQLQKEYRLRLGNLAQMVIAKQGIKATGRFSSILKETLDRGVDKMSLTELESDERRMDAEENLVYLLTAVSIQHKQQSTTNGAIDPVLSLMTGLDSLEPRWPFC